MYLLDTNVVSEFRRKKPHGAVLKWLEQAKDVSLHIGAYTIAEIQIGIEKTRRSDPVKAADLETWLKKIIDSYPVLPLDEKIFRIWAKIIQGKPAHHREVALTAATAIQHSLTVVTRNERDFKQFSVEVLNPFKS